MIHEVTKDQFEYWDGGGKVGHVNNVPVRCVQQWSNENEHQEQEDAFCLALRLYVQVVHQILGIIEKF